MDVLFQNLMSSAKALLTLLLTLLPALAAAADFSSRVTPELRQRYERALRRTVADRELPGQIRRIARLYDLDPAWIAGIVITERTFMDFGDTLQALAVRRAGDGLRFQYEGADLAEVIRRPEYAVCDARKSAADRWDCIADVWVRANGISLHAAFFDPLQVGYSFGIGQIDVLRALMLTDVVQRAGGPGPLSADRPAEIYRHLLDPALALHYIAANLRLGVDTYREIARRDISRDPGIAATLYNLGSEKKRARDLLRRRGEPEENFYGWFMGSRMADFVQFR